MQHEREVPYHNTDSWSGNELADQEVDGLIRLKRKFELVGVLTDRMTLNNHPRRRDRWSG
jgi:hypothetical protein